MHLTILGSGSFLPNEKRNCSGYLLDIGDETLLLDGGSGTLRQIVKAERSVLEVGRVFYSHFHLDHIA
ncbi:MAG TPA: MBL fold metallo-hydrolase, partial [Candidatus Marinimicrobia bacterium]|nr:MBL fold metallo-hydrolase [Candidatus Neomarinimicrobiota bacterium]